MNLKRLAVLAAVAGTSVLSISTAQAADVMVDGKGEIPYVIDGRKVVARSGSGLCWRTGYWSPAAASTAMAGEFPAGCACDGDIVPKDKCEAPKPMAAAPAPMPKPAPAPAPAPAPMPAPKPVSLGATAQFDFDKSVLKPEGKAAIDAEVINRLGGLSSVKSVTVSGHADRIGNAQYNQKLSEKRAEVVKSYLIGQGVDASLIETFGYGKTQPVPGVSCGKMSRKKLIECLGPNRRAVVDVKGMSN